jgi:hypothetical protein
MKTASIGLVSVIGVMAPGCTPAASTSSSVAWCGVEDGVALYAGNPGRCRRAP